MKQEQLRAKADAPAQQQITLWTIYGGPDEPPLDEIYWGMASGPITEAAARACCQHHPQTRILSDGEPTDEDWLARADENSPGPITFKAYQNGGEIISWSFAEETQHQAIQEGQYPVLVVDPDWMDHRQLFRPREIHAPACHIFLWCPVQRLEQGITLVKDWQAAYACTMVWRPTGENRIEPSFTRGQGSRGTSKPRRASTAPSKPTRTDRTGAEATSTKCSAAYAREQ